MTELRPPFRPSWYDTLMDRVDSMAAPTWAIYAVVALATSALLNCLAWLVDDAGVATLDAYLAAGGIYLVIGYAGMHYLDAAAARAWVTLRPATGFDDEEAARFAYRLTTMPAGPALGATAAGLVVSTLFLVGQYGEPYDLESSPVMFLASALVATVGFLGTMGAFYHSVRQLRLISQAHRYVTSIDLLFLDPLHAFASVTAATGLLLLAIGYLALPTNPSGGSNPTVVGLAGAAVLLAITCFVVPLLGMRNAIKAEQARRLEAVNALLAVGLFELHRRAEDRRYDDADGLDHHLSSLITERGVIAGASTWPWGRDTLRAFSGAIVVPVTLWLVYWMLGQTLS